MLYDIRLSIGYDYDAPAAGGRHHLRMMPRTIAGVQRVIAANLECKPSPVERMDRTDFFGNAVTAIRYDTPVRHETFLMRARVERLAPSVANTPSLYPDELARQIDAVHDAGPESPHHFLAPSVRVPALPAISGWAAGVAAPHHDVRAKVEAVCQAIHADMTFSPDATAVDTPVAEAFAARKGVCQDFTHIMIAALRSLGIPSGYVSGFLRTIPPEGEERLEGADAMHAWVRVWLGHAAGWAEFDPTNNMPASDDHVVVAYGRDYFDVAPVKGSMRLSGGQASRQSVDMVS